MYSQALSIPYGPHNLKNACIGRNTIFYSNLLKPHLIPLLTGRVIKFYTHLWQILFHFPSVEYVVGQRVFNFLVNLVPKITMSNCSLLLISPLSLSLSLSLSLTDLKPPTNLFPHLLLTSITHTQTHTLSISYQILQLSFSLYINTIKPSSFSLVSTFFSTLLSVLIWKIFFCQLYSIKKILRFLNFLDIFCFFLTSNSTSMVFIFLYTHEIYRVIGQ